MERMKNVKLDKCYLSLLQTNHFEPFQRTEDLCKQSVVDNFVLHNDSKKSTNDVRIIV